MCPHRIDDKTERQAPAVNMYAAKNESTRRPNVAAIRKMLDTTYDSRYGRLHFSAHRVIN